MIMIRIRIRIMIMMIIIFNKGTKLAKVVFSGTLEVNKITTKYKQKII